MKRVLFGAMLAALLPGLVVASGCASLATPEAPGSGSPGAAGSAAPVSQQVRDGAQLYVDFACTRCHAPDGVGGIPNRLNVGGDSTVPPLSNAYRSTSEQFRTPVQITQVMTDGSILSKRPGVINMPSWKGVIGSAQADAIAAYDPDPVKAPDIYSAYACIDCHGQVGQDGAPNPLTADKSVPGLRNPDDNVPLSELRSVIMEGSIPAPGTKGVIFMPAWGQILSLDQTNTILPYIADGPKATTLPAPPTATPLPLASTPAAGASPSASGSP
jgi:mono/diheme cytochrome c family protein